MRHRLERHLRLSKNLKPLEEKIAHLEHHVTQQDKAMLEFSRELDGLRRELKALRERTPARDARVGEDAATDERPPHY